MANYSFKPGLTFWATSDHHFGQDSFYRQKDDRPIMRPQFESAEQADCEIVRRHNELVPQHGSVVFFLGDLAKNITSAERYVSQMHGETKVLVLGNHDTKFTTASLARLFDKLLGCAYLGDKQLLLTHVPVHPAELRGGHQCAWPFAL